MTNYSYYFISLAKSNCVQQLYCRKNQYNCPTINKINSSKCLGIIFLNLLLCTFEDFRDAEDAKSRLDGAQLLGRDIGVEFTNGFKKTPAEMRDKERTSKRGRSRSRGRSHSRSRSKNRRMRSYSPRRGSPIRRRRDSPRRVSRNSRSDYSRSPSQ